MRPQEARKRETPQFLAVWNIDDRKRRPRIGPGPIVRHDGDLSVIRHRNFVRPITRRDRPERLQRRRIDEHQCPIGLVEDQKRIGAGGEGGEEEGEGEGFHGGEYASAKYLSRELLETTPPQR